VNLNFIKDLRPIKYQGLGCSQLSEIFWATSSGVIVVDRIMAQFGSRENEDRLAILFSNVNDMYLAL
jgi:hypothetical protein